MLYILFLAARFYFIFSVFVGSYVFALCPACWLADDLFSQVARVRLDIGTKTLARWSRGPWSGGPISVLSAPWTSERRP